MNNNPTFICIGPEKTGTSWLYDNLKSHPQVYLPPVKEIRYFWERVFLPNQDISKRLSHSHWHHELYQNYLNKKINSYSNKKNKLSIDNPELIKEMIWDFKYLLLPRDDNWYFSLFQNTNKKVSGDITPLYYQLPESEIQRINSILPNLKIIILLRNPIDRAWSKAKMNLCQHRNREVSRVSQEEFYGNFDKDYKQIPSYIMLIKKWKKYFADDNIYVGYYDKLVQKPSLLFNEICNFLTVEPNLLPSAKRKKLSARVNKGISVNIPPEYLKYLYRKYSNCIEEIAAAEKKEPYPKQWLETMSKIHTH